MKKQIRIIEYLDHNLKEENELTKRLEEGWTVVVATPVQSPAHIASGPYVVTYEIHYILEKDVTDGDI